MVSPLFSRLEKELERTWTEKEPKRKWPSVKNGYKWLTTSSNVVSTAEKVLG